MSPRKALGAVRRACLRQVSRRPVPLGESGPIASFTFDDFPRSARIHGARILETLGVRGTFYAAPGLMGTSTALGEQFDRGDLEALVIAGHEIASHTFAHVSARRVPVNAFAQEVERGYEVLAAWSVPVTRNFAYPYGEATARAKRPVGARMTSCRGTEPGANGPQADLNLLRANALYGDLSQAARAGERIRKAIKARQWIVFYTHDVTEGPSPYGCRPELLARTVEAALAAGARVLPVDEVLRVIGASRPGSAAISEHEEREYAAS